MDQEKINEIVAAVLRELEEKAPSSQTFAGGAALPLAPAVGGQGGAAKRVEIDARMVVKIPVFFQQDRRGERFRQLRPRRPQPVLAVAGQGQAQKRAVNSQNLARKRNAGNNRRG